MDKQAIDRFLTEVTGGQELNLHYDRNGEGCLSSPDWTTPENILKLLEWLKKDELHSGVCKECGGRGNKYKLGSKCGQIEGGTNGVVTCPSCQGSGTWGVWVTCWECVGIGSFPTHGIYSTHLQYRIENGEKRAICEGCHGLSKVRIKGFTFEDFIKEHGQVCYSDLSITTYGPKGIIDHKEASKYFMINVDLIPALPGVVVDFMVGRVK